MLYFPRPNSQTFLMAVKSLISGFPILNPPCEPLKLSGIVIICYYFQLLYLGSCGSQEPDPQSYIALPQVADRRDHRPWGCQVITRKNWPRTIVGNVLGECHAPRIKEPFCSFRKRNGSVPLQKANL